MKITEKITNISGFNSKSTDVFGKLAELEERIYELEARQRACQPPQPIIVEKLYVRRVDVEKFQFKLDGITVDDLSGMLNVGINSDGKMKKKEEKK